MWNKASGTSSVQFEASQKWHLSSCFRYKESSKWDFVCLVQSRVKGEHVLVCPVQGIMLAGLRSSFTKSRKRKACRRLPGTRYQVGGTTSVRFEVTQAELVHVRPVRGIMQAGLCLSVTKSRKRRACPRLAGTSYQAGGTTSVRFEVAQEELVHVRSVRGIR